MRKPIFILLLVLAVAMVACDESQEVANAPRPSVPLSEVLARGAAANPFVAHLDTAPDDNCLKIKIRNIGPLNRVFNDSNHLQLEAARAVGIVPIETDADILKLRRPLVHIVSTPEYYVDDLTHSFPYLVPEAADLLADIGRAFNDSLAARGGGAYRIKVTSLLRTPATVKRLRRVNRNATGESTHQFATTFDISYSKFICDDVTAPHRTFEDLKNLLGEVLADQRDRGRCYVKFERKQSCFHITVRPDHD